jgi:hypothetical protein
MTGVVDLDLSWSRATAVFVHQTEHTHSRNAYQKARRVAHTVRSTVCYMASETWNRIVPQENSRNHRWV